MATRQCTKTRFERSIERIPEGGCWIWLLSLRKDGYGQFHKPDRPRTVGAHRFAWALYRGPIPDGLQVLHRCDVRCCVNPSHLFLGTNQDNMDDMKRKGRANTVRGEQHQNAKLTEAQAREIIALRTAGVSRSDLAIRFRVNPNHIYKILHGLCWAHLTTLADVR